MARDQIFFGRQVLKEALLQKLKVVEIYFEGNHDKDFCEAAVRSTGQRISLVKNLPREVPGAHAQGVAFKVSHDFYLDALPEDFEEKFPRVLLLNHLQDVQNLGAIIRSAAAFGFDLLVHENRRSVQLSPIAVRISQGQAFRIKFWEPSNLSPFIDKLRDRGFEIVGLDVENAGSLFKWKPASRVAFVLGSEESGIQKSLRDRLDQCLKIPMQSKVESLNVSHAASIAMAWVYGNK